MIYNSPILKNNKLVSSGTRLLLSMWNVSPVVRRFPSKADLSMIFFETACNNLLIPMQGLHPAPLSRFVTSVSRAKLTLEEAARLLTLLWRVSLPTEGPCTLHCEQVGGDMMQRPRDATVTHTSVSFTSGPGPGSPSPQSGTRFGECVKGGDGTVSVKRVCQALSWVPPVCSSSSPSSPGTLPGHFC